MKLNFLHLKFFLLLGTTLLQSLYLELIYANSGTGNLNSPEHQIREVKSSLENLHTKVKGIKELKEDNLKTQTFFANHSLQKAEKYLEQKNPNAALLEIQAYVAGSQKPEIKNHLKALLVAARSRETLGFSNLASRNYREYLATTLTSKEISESEKLDAIRKILSLSPAIYPQATQIAFNLLSSLASIEFSESRKRELEYLLGRASRTLGRFDLAKDFFDKLYDEDTNPQSQKNSELLKYQAQYFQSLMMISTDDFSEGKNGLLKLEATLSKHNEYSELKNALRLALARVYMRERNYLSACTYYSEVETNTTSTKQAWFEGSFAAIKAKNWSLASNFTNQFVEKWPVGRESIQMQNLSSFLKIQTGELNDAESVIRSADKQYADFGMNLKNTFLGKQRINFLEIQKIVEASDKILQKNSLLAGIEDNFNRIDESLLQTEMLIGDLSQSIYMIARSDTIDFLPYLHRKLEQTLRISEDNLVEAHKLSQVEQSLLNSTLTAKEKLHLEKSLEYRDQLFNVRNGFKRSQSQWTQWINIDLSNQMLADLTVQNQFSFSSIAAIKMLRKSNSVETISDIEVLESEHERLSKQLSKLRYLLREVQSKENISFNPLNQEIKLHHQLTELFEQESQLFSETRQRLEGFNQKYFIEDIEQLWNNWKFNQGVIFQELQELKTKIHTKSHQSVSEIGQLKQNLENKKRKLLDLRSKQEKLAASIGPAIVSQYERVIDQQRAKHLKWVADISQLKYLQKTASQSELENKIEIQSQLLKHNLDIYRADRGLE